MSARFARSAFHAAARRASVAPNAARSMGRRTMASSAEGASKKSDTPWILASAAIFGPAFLYLVSPSARKNTHVEHNDKHDFPTSKTLDHPTTPPPAKKAEEAAPAQKVTMKDAEGKEADVTGSLALAEEANVPKAAVSAEKLEETKTEAESEGAAASESADTSSESESSEAGRTDKSGSFKKPGEDGPTDMKVAEDAAQKGVPPKKHVEESS